MAVARDLAGRQQQRRVRDRRRRHVRRHGLRGHEQRRRAQRAPDRHPQRQRHVDRAAGRRAVDLSRPHLLERHLPALARGRQAARQEAAQELGAPRRPRRGVHAHLLDRRHAVRGAGLLLRRAHRRPRPQRAAARCCATCATPSRGRSSCTSSPRRARATRRPRPPTTSTTASTASTSSPARRSSAKPNAPSYTKVFAAEPDRGGAARTTRSSPSPRRCRRAPASICSARRSPSAPSTSASPSSTASPSPPASPPRASSRSPPSTRPSCSAPTTRSCTTSPSSACPCASRSTAPGLVGADGPTHAGSFDLAYLGCLPGFVLMAAADEAELKHMVATAVAIDDRPSAFRYPRGEGTGVELPAEGRPLEIGKGRIVREGSAVALLSLGTRLRRMPEGRRPAGRARPVRPPWRTRASPSRSTPTSSAGSRRTTRC